MERSASVSQRGPRSTVTARREIDKLMKSLGTMPRILCWKCRRLTPFELDRCQHCGSAFAGSTGGAYRGSERLSTSSSTSSSFVREEEQPVTRARSLREIVEDLRHVRDLSAPPRQRRREEEESVTLYQCPTCGRFVSQASKSCACGAQFAPLPPSMFECPECASSVPVGKSLCPVCGVDFRSASRRDAHVYACPRCGAHVKSDAVRCSCGAWFED